VASTPHWYFRGLGVFLVFVYFTQNEIQLICQKKKTDIHITLNFLEGEYCQMTDDTIMRCGTGKHITVDGVVMEGTWDCDKLHGKGL